MAANVSRKKPFASPPKPGERRRRHTPAMRCEQLLKALEVHFKREFPDDSFSSFTRTAWEGFNGKLAPERGDDFIRAMVHNFDKLQLVPAPEGEEKLVKWIALFVSAAYCYEAINACSPHIDVEDPAEERDKVVERMQELHRAWDYAFDAAQWEGFFAGILDQTEGVTKGIAQISERMRGLNDLKHKRVRAAQSDAKAWYDVNRHTHTTLEAVKKIAEIGGIVPRVAQRWELKFRNMAPTSSDGECAPSDGE